MFRRAKLSESQFVIDAIDRSMAIIEFGMDGTILTANPNFTKVVGYDLSEIKGKHHRIFIEDAIAKSPEYEQFWAKLRAGEFISGEFMRLDKNKRRVWLEASYNPVLDQNGKPLKVIKVAADITAKKNEVSRLLTMIDDMPVAVMTADPKDDFKINYLNSTSSRTLERSSSICRSRWPTWLAGPSTSFTRIPTTSGTCWPMRAAFRTGRGSRSDRRRSTSRYPQSRIRKVSISARCSRGR